MRKNVHFLVAALCLIISIVVFELSSKIGTFKDPGKYVPTAITKLHIAADGVELQSLFEGLPQHPEVAAKIRSIATEPRVPCKPESKFTKLLNSFNLNLVAHAQPSCGNGQEPCQGCNQKVLSYFCYSPCELGSQSYVEYDIDCPKCGQKHNGQFNCFEHCGCNVSSCFNDSCS